MRSLQAVKVSSVFAALMVVLLNLLPAVAASANISRSYAASSSIPAGSIVSLDPSQQDHVVAANSDNAPRLVGVAVSSDDSLIAVNPATGKVQVATSGSANTLVSTLNGPIKSGDAVAVSPFNGVGKKAGPGEYIIGLAQTDFNDKTGGAKVQEVTDKSGHKQQIYVGFVKLNIAVTMGSATPNSQNLSAIQRIGKSLTGHTISSFRVIMALVIAAIAMLALVTLIYTSIYSSIIAIGRNPLAKYAVFRTLGAVLGMIAAISVIASLSVFFLLH